MLLKVFLIRTRTRLFALFVQQLTTFDNTAILGINSCFYFSVSNLVFT